MYSHLGSNKDYRSQKTPIKVDKNNILSNYQRAINQSNYQNIYQASLINKEKNQQQKKNIMSPTKGTNSNKLFKTSKNNELVIQYNFNNSKDKEDSNERYFESNEYQDNNIQINSNGKNQDGQNKLQFFSPQHHGTNTYDFFGSPEKDNQINKNKQIPINQEAQKTNNFNNYTINDDESKLQIKELIDMCPDIKNNDVSNLNETLSFIHNRSSLNNSNFNPTISNLFVSQKIANENIDFPSKKNNFDVALESFRKKNGKLTDNNKQNVVNLIQENNFLVKNNNKNNNNLSKISTKLSQNTVSNAQININDNEGNRKHKEDKHKLADLSNYNIMNNLLISNQSISLKNQNDINEFSPKIETEIEHEKEKEKFEEKLYNIDVVNMASKKDSISNYNSLGRNFIFSYEEDDIKEYLQEGKDNNTMFSIQNMEENKIEKKRMVNSNSFVGDLYINDDNKSIYFNKLEHQNQLNNSHDAISNSTHLFPIFEKNLDFEIESPTNFDKNKNAYDTNDSTSQEVKFHNRNMEISKFISNHHQEENQIPKFTINLKGINHINEVQENNDEEKLTTRNMVKSYANFYKNNENYMNSEQENNEELAKRINFFSNDNNLLVSIDDSETKGIQLNNPDNNVFISPHYNLNDEKATSKLLPLDKFNFFESNDLMRSVNIKKLNDEIKIPVKIDKESESKKENEKVDNTKFNQQLSQLSELVLFSPQNRNNQVTPNYVNKFINTTTSKTKTRLTNENPQLIQEKEPFVPSSTPNILNKNQTNNQINENFKKKYKSKTNLNKSDLMIENTEKFVFESVKKSGSPQRISSKINLDIFSDGKPIELEPKMIESNKVLPSSTLQTHVLTNNKPKIINEEKIDNMVIKLSSKNSLVSLNNQNNMNSYSNNGSMLKIHSRKHILNNYKQNSFNIHNDSGNANNVNSQMNRKESKKYSVGINEKHELRNKEKVIPITKKSKHIEKPIIPNHKLIQNTSKKNNLNNEVFSPSNKGIKPSSIISTNSQIFSPSNYENNHIEFKTEKNSISDLLSPTSNLENISYISKFNLDTSKNNNSSISRTINTESSNKISKKANDSTQNLDPKNPNFSSKKSILEDKVQFEKQVNPNKIMKNLLNKFAFSKDGYINNFKDDLQILNIDESELNEINK